MRAVANSGGDFEEAVAFSERLPVASPTLDGFRPTVPLDVGDQGFLVRIIAELGLQLVDGIEIATEVEATARLADLFRLLEVLIVNGRRLFDEVLDDEAEGTFRRQLGDLVRIASRDNAG